MFQLMELNKTQISSLDVCLLPLPKQRWQLETDGPSFVLLMHLAPEAEWIFIKLTDFFQVLNPAQSGKSSPNRFHPSELWSKPCCRSMFDRSAALSGWERSAEFSGHLQHSQADGRRWRWNGGHDGDRWGEVNPPNTLIDSAIVS